MKRKLFITLMAIWSMICICFTTTAFAATTASVTLTSDNTSPKQGATVTVTVALSGCEAAKSMLIRPEYDNTVLELQSGEWLLEGYALKDNWTAAYGDAVIAFADATDMNGSVFKMIFKVLDGAALESTGIDCEVTIKNGETVMENMTIPAKVRVTCSSHTYTEKAAEEYLKTAATCQSQAVYYESCSACGEAGTDTFEAGGKDAGNHEKDSFIYQPNADGATHAKRHECCGAVAVESEAHTWKNNKCTRCKVEKNHEHAYIHGVVAPEHKATEATCQERATYYKSCSCGANGTETFEGGEKDMTNHTKSAFIYTANADGTSHTKKYECCETVAAAKEAHTYGASGKCVCGAEKAHEHTYGEDGKCACGAEKPHEHTYGEDGKCACGAEKAHEHTYGEDGKCACGAEKAHEHTYGEDGKCACGAEKAHEHSYDEDGKCACGAAEASFPWWIILVVLVLVGGGFALYWFLIKKKDQDEEQEQ